MANLPTMPKDFSFVVRGTLAILLVLAIAGCATLQPRLLFDAPAGTVEIRVEIADTPAERETGLMHRDSLAEDAGMLFILDDEEVVGFWMKDTRIPLDIIFIDSNWRIVNIRRSAQPCTEEPCESYFSDEPVRYVLEVNAGFAEQHSIGQSDSIRLVS